MTEVGIGLDRFATVIVPDVSGMWTYRVDAWGDPWATWLHTVEVKMAAGQDGPELANDLETGARLLERVSRRPDRRMERPVLVSAAARCAMTALPLPIRVVPRCPPRSG